MCIRDRSKSHIYAENITGFMTYIEKLTTNDEDEIVSRLCKIITGIYINDWKNDSYERFVEELTYVKNTIQSIKESEQSTEGEMCIRDRTYTGAKPARCHCIRRNVSVVEVAAEE